MKRSEMLEKLSFYYETDELDTPHDARINAERVLRLIEKAGMLPPEYVINEDTPDRDSFNEWEEE